MAKTTIFDVSQRAGVSIATVSRALNSPDQVTIKTRERVLLAVNELNFVPKFEAIHRARKASGRIGVLTPFPTSDSFVDRLDGVLASLESLQYETIIYNIGSQAQRDSYLTNLAITRSVDGLLLALPTNPTVGKSILKHQLPIVQIVDTSLPFDAAFNSILIDNARGATMIAEYLLAKGHRCIGFIGDLKLPDFLNHTSEVKLDNFRKTLAEGGIALPNTYVGLSSFGMEQARQQAHRLLELPKPPSAIFAASDTQAIGVLAAAREKGLSVPNDLAVVGFDDIETASFIGLTTIRQYLKDSGQKAIEILLASIADYQTPVQHLVSPLTLIERASS